MKSFKSWLRNYKLVIFNRGNDCSKKYGIRRGWLIHEYLFFPYYPQDDAWKFFYEVDNGFEIEKRFFVSRDLALNVLADLLKKQDCPFQVVDYSYDSDTGSIITVEDE